MRPSVVATSGSATAAACGSRQHLMSLLVIPNVLHLLQHSQTKPNFVARISFLDFLLCRQQQQSKAGVTKNANICSQSCQPSAEYTAAPRRTQMKLAQMTLYANIFKISLLLGHFLLPPPNTTLLLLH